MKNLFILASTLFCFGFAGGQIIWTSETKLKGTIGEYPIVMTLAIPLGGASTCLVIGEYCYASKKKNIDLCSEDEYKIIESVDGYETGYFILNNDWEKKIGTTIFGSWHSMDGKKSYPVNLKVTGKGEY